MQLDAIKARFDHIARRSGVVLDDAWNFIEVKLACLHIGLFAFVSVCFAGCQSAAG